MYVNILLKTFRWSWLHKICTCAICSNYFWKM